ncbi:DUF2024 family protein [Flagellimonas meishanensis]|uniref:DUF2024 family protein n=1 Tax=Flagellimonas meishanensis TaxID=2873264 RepID=UPI001CA621B2|nr:DUF2024 family protein [[Muricauda] meishanensis]
MRVAVWDTYVQRNDGLVMHFDILVPDDLENEEVIFRFGKEYLNTKPFATGKLSAEECRFCHMEVAPYQVVEQINKKGYFVIEMENCS